MPRMVRGFWEGWKRAAKTIFVMIAMLGSLLLPSSAPHLVALLDIAIPCVILSTLLKPPLRSDQAYDFRSSLLDILIVSIARSFAIISAYFLRGARCDAYLMIAALLGLISAALVAVKACVFAMVVASSPPPSPELGSNFGVAMIFVSSFACAVGHGVSAYRTSCQAKKKSFPQGDEESRFFYKYITVKLKLFRSSNLHKDDEDVESDEKLPLCALVADDNSKFMLCKGLHLHYKLLQGTRSSRALARSGSLPLDHDHHLPGGRATLLRSSSSSLASCSLARDDPRERNFVEFSKSSSNGIVLVHGFGGGVFSWRHIIAPLARQTGYSVASFDRPGWGLTSRTSECGGKDKQRGGVPIPNPYQLLSQVDLLLSFCQQVNFTSVVLVGHDDGGLLALMAAAKALENPASFQVAVEGVVLIGVSFSRQAIPTFARVLLHTSLGRKILRPLLCSEMASRRAWHDASKLTSEVMELYKVPLRVEEWDHHHSRKLEQVTPDLLRIVHNLPALLVAGTHDMLVPLQAVQDLASKLSKSKLVAIPRCGHLPPEECPAALLAALVPFVTEIFKSPPSMHSTANI